VESNDELYNEIKRIRAAVEKNIQEREAVRSIPELKKDVFYFWKKDSPQMPKSIMKMWLNRTNIGRHNN